MTDDDRVDQVGRAVDALDRRAERLGLYTDGPTRPDLMPVFLAPPPPPPPVLVEDVMPSLRGSRYALVSG